MANRQSAIGNRQSIINDKSYQTLQAYRPTRNAQS
jgi:hypothetical protein